MKYFFSRWIVAFCVFLFLDFLWLGFVAQQLYQQHIGFLMTTTPVWSAAILFYILFIAGLVVFVLSQDQVRLGAANIALRGAFFGLVTYATFDLTAQALIKDWPWLITAIDLLWGTLLSTTVSLVTYFIFSKRTA